MSVKVFYSLLLLLALSCSSTKQSGGSLTSAPFPLSHQGIWQGDLTIYKNDSAVQTLRMTLTILPTETIESYSWKIKYDTQASRNYQLKAVDAQKGIYEIDENNGIVLPALLNNQQLSSFFSVMKNTLLINTDFSQKNQIIYTVNIYGIEANTFTGQANEMVDSIGIYPFLGYQQAVLYKQ